MSTLRSRGTQGVVVHCALSTVSHLKVAYYRGPQSTDEPGPQGQLVKTRPDAPVPELVITHNAYPGGWEEREVGSTWSQQGAQQRLREDKDWGPGPRV